VHAVFHKFPHETCKLQQHIMMRKRMLKAHNYLLEPAPISVYAKSASVYWLTHVL